MNNKDGEDSKTIASDTRETVPFTVFEKQDRLLLMLILPMIGFWSAVLSPIYFPAIPIVAKYFDISNALLNISVVTYLIFQGLAPAVSSSLADYFGARPVLVCSVLGYTAVCIAISQTNVYWLFLVLRCLQLALIAPVIAIASGVSGDVCTRENRGGFIGTVGGFQLIGSGFGAVIGSALISGFNTWRSIFVFLAIGGGVTLFIATIILPETSRQHVGNGLIYPKGFQHKLLLLYLPHFSKKLTNHVETIEPRRPFDILATFRLLLHWDMIIVLVPCGIIFAAWTCMLAEISTVLELDPFNYSVIHVGLVYLPQGLITLPGSIISGKLLNKYYAYRLDEYINAGEAQKSKEQYEKEQRGEDVSEENMLNSEEPLDRPAFDYSRARLDICLIPIGVFIIGLTMFGWCLQYKLNIATIYVSSIMVALSLTVIISAVTTVVVDMNPSQGNSLASCVNIMRCWLGALFVGVLDKMISKMGLGGCFTFFAAFTAMLSGVTIWRFYGKAERDYLKNKKEQNAV